ncbi:MAG: DUF2953 domain-containing protein [Oscillospiraceae bacterium]|nr:DUF2953 domain-containing protein [Oscillospiraceae bacterium]
MGGLIAAGVLLAFMLIPVGICLIYDTKGFYLYLRIGLIRICLYPRKKIKTPIKESKKNQTKSTESSKQNEKSKGKLSDFMPILQIVFDFLHDFRSKLRITNLQMKLILANNDPCDLAIAYGSAWAALGNLMPLLERYFIIKNRNLEVECDFEATENLLNARIDIAISFGGLLYILIKHGFRGIKKYIELSKNLKAV